MCIGDWKIPDHYSAKNTELDGYKIIARKESTTGFLSVSELPTKYGPIRILRCDHSILGGGYVNHNLSSIYGTFYYMDFVKFIDRPKLISKPLNVLQL